PAPAGPPGPARAARPARPGRPARTACTTRPDRALPDRALPGRAWLAGIRGTQRGVERYAQPGELGERRPRVVTPGSEPAHRYSAPAARRGQVAGHLGGLRPVQLCLGAVLV